MWYRTGTSGSTRGVVRRGDGAGIPPPSSAAVARRALRAGPSSLGVAEAARLLQEVALALDHAHAHGIVHRDVKPDNILLDSATGRALVSDFGIARAVNSGPVTTGPHLLGTAEFMSPEQAGGGPLDERSDIYSLGVVGFYALSGRLPFEGSDPMTVLAQHVTDPPPPLASVAPGVPRRLAAIVDRCLAKDPAARFPSGAALAAAIADAVRPRTAPAVAVRAFVTESKHLSTGTRLYLAFASLALPLLGLDAWTAFDRWARIGDLAAAALIAALPLVVMVTRVRRLLRAGFERQDLTGALREEYERRREELAFLDGDGPSRLERVLRGLCYAALGAAAGLVVAADRGAVLGGASLAFDIALGTALLAAVGARWRTEHRTDPQAERRLRFWSGFPGRWLFGLARLTRAAPEPET